MSEVEQAFVKALGVELAPWQNRIVEQIMTPKPTAPATNALIIIGTPLQHYRVSRGFVDANLHAYYEWPNTDTPNGDPIESPALRGAAISNVIVDEANYNLHLWAKRGLNYLHHHLRETPTRSRMHTMYDHRRRARGRRRRG